MVRLRIKLESSSLKDHLEARRVHLYKQIAVYSMHIVFVLGHFILHYSLTAYSADTLKNN